MEPIFEADFTDNAYGYRPQRGAQDAIKHVHQAPEGRLHRRGRCGHLEVLRHDPARRAHALGGPAGERRAILHLVKMWLKAPVEEKHDDGTRTATGAGGQGIGTPQGGVISPLLANIYMRRFLLAWEQQELAKEASGPLVNYADDFVILCRGTARRGLAAAEHDPPTP